MTRPPPRGGRRPGPLGIVALAGWLFADLLLVLALVSMADRPDPLAVRRPPPSTSPQPSSSPTPTGPRSLVKKAEEFEVRGTDQGKLIAEIRKKTAPWSGREAALVMTFGGSANGTEYARRVNSLLGRARPKMFTRQTATENFHELDRPPSTAQLTLYFYTSTR